MALPRVSAVLSAHACGRLWTLRTFEKSGVNFFVSVFPVLASHRGVAARALPASARTPSPPHSARKNLLSWRTCSLTTALEK